MYLAQLSLIFPAVVLAYIPDYIYLDENCDGDLAFSYSLVLQYSFSNRLRQSSSEQCSITLGGGRDRQVQSRFVWISTEYDSRCSEEKVVISDSTGPLTPSPGICGTTAPTTLYRTEINDELKINFITDDTIRSIGNFKILLTAFSKAERGMCSRSGDFFCKNGICISSQLKCNGYDECGDGSDEPASCNHNDKDSLSHHIGLIVIIIIFGSVFIMAILLIITWCCRKKLGYNSLEEE